MKYRQWKKNYKKKHGVNPPLELDKRKQRRLARKMANILLGIIALELLAIFSKLDKLEERGRENE